MPKPEEIHEMLENNCISPNMGAMLEVFKNENGMSRLDYSTDLLLEKNKAIILILKFWWEMPETAKETIEKNDRRMKELEDIFSKKRWHVLEKRSEPYLLEELKGIHLQILSIKTQYNIGPEAQQ